MGRKVTGQPKKDPQRRWNLFKEAWRKFFHDENGYLISYFAAQRGNEMLERDGSYGDLRVKSWTARVTLSCKGEESSRYGIVARLFFFLFRSRERSSLATSFSLFEGCFKAWYRKDGFVQLDSDYLFLTWKRIVEEEELYVELFETFEKYIYIHFPLFTLPRKRRFTKKREKQRWKWFLSPFLAPFHRSRRIVHFTLLPDKKESVRYYINCLLWLFQFEDR